jgi:hypothetical protein
MWLMWRIFQYFVSGLAVLLSAVLPGLLYERIVHAAEPYTEEPYTEEPYTEEPYLTEQNLVALLFLALLVALLFGLVAGVVQSGASVVRWLVLGISVALLQFIATVMTGQEWLPPGQIHIAVLTGLSSGFAFAAGGFITDLKRLIRDLRERGSTSLLRPLLPDLIGLAGTLLSAIITAIATIVAG